MDWSEVSDGRENMCANINQTLLYICTHGSLHKAVD